MDAPNPDWVELSNILSPSSLAALRQHLDGNNTTEVVEDHDAIRPPHHEQPLDFKKYGVGAPNAVFKLQTYWEDRFSTEDSYDWLVTWKQARPYMEKFMRKTDRILIVGCGNSSFSAEIYDAGYENIVNIDFSQNVIDKMRGIHNELRPKMTWEVMDMTAMTFSEGEFDLVIDKAAMDALVVDEGDVWDPDLLVIQKVDNMSISVDRVLNKVGGRFLQLSFAQPHFRTKYLMGFRAEGQNCSAYESKCGQSSRYGWFLNYEVIAEEGCLSTFLYIMKR